MESTKDKETLGGMENREPSTDDVPGTTQAPSNDSKQVTASIRDAVTPVLLIYTVGQTLGRHKKKPIKRITASLEVPELYFLSA